MKYTFIAADCGNQPRTTSPDERSDFENIFPGLVRCEWSITAAATANYNCIAWSVGIADKWIGQVGPPEYGDEFMDRDYGDNDGVFEDSDVDAFYAAKGFSTVASGPEDAAVMYYSNFHGARKKGCGCGALKWMVYESKCGESVRIEHLWDQLNGSPYGSPTKYYK